MMIKITLGAAVALFATVAGTSSALAQVMPQPTLTVGTVAPQVTATATKDPNLPPNIMLHTKSALGEPQFMDTESAIKMFGAEKVSMVVEGNKTACARLAKLPSQAELDGIDAELEALNVAAAKDKKARKKWSIGRALLGIGQTLLGFGIGGKGYGLIVGLGQAQSAGDRIEYQRLLRIYNGYLSITSRQMQFFNDATGIWTDSMRTWCGAMEGYMLRTSTVKYPQATPVVAVEKK